MVIGEMVTWNHRGRGQTLRRRWRIHHFIVVLLCGYLCAAAPAGASRCALGPITDVQASQLFLKEWVAATNLPPVDEAKSGLSIDHSQASLTLQFAQGALVLAWEVGDDCKPTGVKIQASADYEGMRPDEEAVKRLAAGFQIVALEQRLGAPFLPATRVQLSILRVGAGLALAGLLLLVALGLLSVLLRLVAARSPLAGRHCHTASVAVGAVTTGTFARLSRMPLSSWLRLLGLTAIVVMLPYQSQAFVQASTGAWLSANSMVLLGVMPLMIFLWLAASGLFGYGSPKRSDWVALVPFFAGLIACEALTLHSIEEIEIHFYTGYLPDKNSLLHPLFQMFMGRFATDPYSFMMHVNGTMEALAVLPLFLFVRQRTGSRMAAFVTAFFFALQPVTTRFAPTDGPYSLIFLTWFSGLALLSAAELGGRQLFAGATLLAIAATCRMEGTLYLAASVLLLDVRSVFRALTNNPLAAALSTFAVGLLVAVHWIYCLPMHSTSAAVTLNPQALPMDQLTWNSFRSSLLGPTRNDQVFCALLVVGALAGLVDRRLRIGLGAALGALIITLPMTGSGDGGIIPLHRLVPVCGLQAITAGVGAFWITRIVPLRLRNNWITVAPAVIAALYIFVMHRAELTERYVFNEEFDMLRRHLGPGRLSNPDCSLLSFSGKMDVDLHSVWQVLPAMHVVDCREGGCPKSAERGGCIYYFRSLVCYLQDDAVPAQCASSGATADGGRLACLRAECARVEKSLVLSPIEERTVYPHRVWEGGDLLQRYPQEAGIGLYRVLGVRNTATTTGAG